MQRAFRVVGARGMFLLATTTVAISGVHAATAVRGSFGTLADGTAVESVELTTAKGVKARVITYGATLQTLEAPDRNGVLDSITLGYDTIAGYEQTPKFFGATIGRVANRIGSGHFELDGKSYQLALNDGKNSLHGGARGFDKRLWSIAAVTAGHDSASVTLARVSPDGEEGYPGNLAVRVTYELSEAGELSIHYRATTDRTTVVSLTNHSVFNLAGARSGRGALDSILQIEADGYTPVDAGLIPTGAIQPVAGTPFDFRKPMPLGARLRDGRDPQVLLARGIDHNFAIRGGVTAKPKLVLTIVDAKSGRGMRILSTEPGLQVATSNRLDGTVQGRGGQVMRQGDGVALEAQHFPNAPNVSAFASVRLEPGAIYEQLTIHQLFLVP
jgi:aldose 1-epimerase